MAIESKQLSSANVDLSDIAEVTALRTKRLEELTRRKRAIVSGLIEDGRLDENGDWHFKEPLPEDMRSDSLADFKH